VRGRFSASSGDSGGTTSGGYRFTALQKVDRMLKQRAAFDLCWRTMRDQWYDERHGNRDWNVIRKKYLDMAGEAIDMETFTTVVQLTLGEFNGSHLGFYAAVRRHWPGTTLLPTRRPRKGGGRRQLRISAFVSRRVARDRA
jgi:hypothetical protein